MGNMSTAQISTNHKRLLKLSRISVIFAWLALILSIFRGVNLFFYLKCESWEIQLGECTQDFQFYFSKSTNIIFTLFIGFVWWVVLYGIAYGLRMIVETDLNYRQIDHKDSK
jgi:hypothetical protein